MADTYIKKDIVGKADSVAVIDIGSNSIRYAAGRNGKKPCYNIFIESLENGWEKAIK